jgi:hypothetical protein
MTDVAHFVELLKLTEVELLDKYRNLNIYFNWNSYDSSAFLLLKAKIRTTIGFYTNIERLKDMDVYGTILKLLDVANLNGTEIDKKLDEIFIGRPQYNSGKSC